MASKLRFVCNVCGYESGKWYGRCPSCSNWNTFAQFKVEDKKRTSYAHSDEVAISLEKAYHIKTSSNSRVSTGFEEFDRVLGGGVVLGSVILLSGDPGIGKSTILLQLALNVSNMASRKVLYITGEESSDQVKMRIERLINVKDLEKRNLFIISATNIDQVLEVLSKEKPTLVIIDSVQTMESKEFPGFPGSIPQIRNATSSFVSFAKKNQIPVFLVGHVTKEGIVAGPMLLSHMVDAVLYLEGEKLSETRILRAFKNRFGDATEVGIFIMKEKGLLEIKDASSYFMDKKNEKVPGSCIAVVMEGTRPMMVEVQALVVPSGLSFPRRVVNGISEKRVELLLAVIQKHVKIPVDRADVFVNVVGGMKILENASDLAVCLAVVSSFKNKPLGSTAAVSEIGLLGELRNVSNLEKRMSEARKFGFKNVLTFKDFKFLNEVIPFIPI
ncbi:MAG: DNA repair protein RadA [Candidatus Levybacteria bacterium RIFCSPHIGHO2_01_FULL_36_15]|nr:MAG: DNA repair protein RadA [Candidatus Levybacteria bacterium RIFCSPHIGHO2_01_FULL_36_15]OGH38726.1 MAG: DNA repair protein RadA [Candidatus Levybacteria bacterium RIFCSPLOWO2_01_FULL_36_10]